MKQLPDNISVCTKCDKKTDDDNYETVFDKDADPFCEPCYLEEYGSDEIYVKHEMLKRIGG